MTKIESDSEPVLVFDVFGDTTQDHGFTPIPLYGEVLRNRICVFSAINYQFFPLSFANVFRLTI